MSSFNPREHAFTRLVVWGDASGHHQPNTPTRSLLKERCHLFQAVGHSTSFLQSGVHLETEVNGGVNLSCEDSGRGGRSQCSLGDTEG